MDAALSTLDDLTRRIAPDEATREALTQQPADPVIQLARRHGVEVLLARCSNAQSAPLPEPLRVARRNAVAKELHLRAELRKTVVALRAAGVEALAYKGIVLSQRAYGDSAVREMGDLDLLIRPADISAVETVFDDLGYVPLLELHDASRERLLRAARDASWSRRDGLGHFEVHWSLPPLWFPHSPSHEELWEHSQTLAHGRGELPCLSVEHELLALLLNGANHGWSHLKWIADFAWLTATLDEAQASRFSSAVRRWRAEAMLGIAVALCDRLFAQSPLRSILGLREPSRSAHRAAQTIVRNLLSPPQGSSWLVKRTRLALACVDSPAGKLRALRLLVFRPAFTDRELAAERGGGPLRQALRRPFRLFTKYVARR